MTGKGLPPGVVWVGRSHEEIGCLAGCELKHGLVKVTDRDAWLTWLMQDAMTKLGLVKVDDAIQPL